MGPLLGTNYIKNQRYQNMTIIKVALLFLHSSMKKIETDSVDFLHRKMTLKVKMLLFLTIKRPKSFLFQFL